MFQEIPESGTWTVVEMQDWFQCPIALSDMESHGFSWKFGSLHWECPKENQCLTAICRGCYETGQYRSIYGKVYRGEME